MKINISVTAILGVLLGISASLACWAPTSLNNIVKDNPVVLIGKIEKIKVAAPAERAYDIAYIKVNKVLKNDLKKVTIKKGTHLPLVMPSVNSKVEMSTDIRYRKGAAGIWILHDSKLGFQAAGPWGLQSFKDEKKLVNIIATEKKARNKKIVQRSAATTE